MALGFVSFLDNCPRAYLKDSALFESFMGRRLGPFPICFKV